MKCNQSRPGFWTRVTVSISYDNNHYTTSTSLTVNDVSACKCIFVNVHVQLYVAIQQFSPNRSFSLRRKKWLPHIFVEWQSWVFPFKSFRRIIFRKAWLRCSVGVSFHLIGNYLPWTFFSKRASFPLFNCKAKLGFIANEAIVGLPFCIALVCKMFFMSHWYTLTYSMRCQCLDWECIKVVFKLFLCWKRIFMMTRVYISPMIYSTK